MLTETPMKNLRIVILLLLAFACGWLVNHLIISEQESTTNATENDNGPLYWVAPMDANYKRDQPGKSPMGMDLVPVYASQTSPGTVNIAANVMNNLGVRTTTVTMQQQRASIDTFGMVGYNEDSLVHIHPRVEGWVEKLFIKATGDYVIKGAPLYALYSPELVNAQEEYLLALQRSNKNLIQAAEARLLALQMPKSEIEKLKSKRKIDTLVTFYAPQTGFIDNLNIREGFFVKPGVNLMTIGALDEVWVEADIFASQAQLLQIGQSVSISLAYLPGKSFTGNIDYIYPSLEQETRTLRARIRVPNPGYELKPNMFADLQIYISRQNAFLSIPTEALIRSGQHNRAVLALGGGNFKSVIVEVGLINDQYAQVLSGLEDGDQVVASAQFLIDSQSSISSDFKRMNTHLMNEQPKELTKLDASTHARKQNIPNTTWTIATIEDVMAEDSLLTLSHGALDDWNMPAMTMDFMLADDIDASTLIVNTQINVEISKTDMGMFKVITVKQQGTNDALENGEQP